MKATWSKQSLQLQGNEPQLLDDSLGLWIVESGTLALFAVTLEQGTPAGARHYLLSINPNEALFAIAPTLGEKSQGVLAVPLEETTIRVIPKADFAMLLAQEREETVALVEGWVNQLSYAFSDTGNVRESQAALSAAGLGAVPLSQDGATSEVEHLPQGTQYFSVAKNQTFGPQKNSVSWVQIQQGQARLLGFQELTLTPDSGLLPLSAGMWLVADEPVDLAAVNTSLFRDSNVLLEGIAHLHELCLRLLNIVERKEAIAEQERFQARELLNQQVTTGALGELVSVLTPKPAELVTGDTDLLIAAGAVGRALGITIRPPAKSENLDRVKNPLEAIARASRLRMRRVLLSDHWWEKDCGPLLAYTGENNQPVALLPIGAGKYELVDPKTETRTAVNTQVADTLAATAYMFYRPLPDR